GVAADAVRFAPAEMRFAGSPFSHGLSWYWLPQRYRVWAVVGLESSSAAVMTHSRASAKRIISLPFWFSRAACKVGYRPMRRTCEHARKQGLSRSRLRPCASRCVERRRGRTGKWPPSQNSQWRYHPHVFNVTRSPPLRTMDRYHVRDLSSLVEPDRVRKEVYTDPAIFDLEMQRIHERVWIYCGHVSQIPNAGDYTTVQIGRQPMIMVRANDGGVHVLYNRCPHRGAMLCGDRAGNARDFFRCSYHAWTFEHDGRLRNIPMMESG